MRIQNFPSAMSPTCFHSKFPLQILIPCFDRFGATRVFGNLFSSTNSLPTPITETLVLEMTTIVVTSEEDPALSVVRFTSELAWADAGPEVSFNLLETFPTKFLSFKFQRILFQYLDCLNCFNLAGWSCLLKILVPFALGRFARLDLQLICCNSNSMKTY